MIARRGDRQRP